MYSKTDQSRSQKWDRISLIRENSGKCEQENAEIFTAAWKGKEYFKQSWNVKFSVWRLIGEAPNKKIDLFT
jgi:uncharacterized protein YjaG (DUF416 family)